MIENLMLKILIGIVILFSIVLTIMLAISFGLWISKP